MLSVASLLNPAKSEPRSTRLPSSPPSSLCTSSPSYGHPLLPIQSSFIKKQKMTKDGAVFAKGTKIKGDVNFPPFEHLSEETMREVQKFHVYPLGKIQDYCRHIPYNSEKKNFLEKTGRESFEVFQYVFKVPGDDKDYTVMWDYNVGLVRITPFFKCCKYSKTTPAKMLGLNPGLKEITHSITGGALAAQGYWMPYSCALAVCTTFCSHIAPALIPIFGPSFPSQCVVPDAPEHGRMIIDPHIIHTATAEAESYRLQYTSLTPKSSASVTPRDSASPQQQSSNYMVRTNTMTPPASSSSHLERRLRLKRTYGGESPYAESSTDHDATSETSSGDAAYFCSPVTPTSGLPVTNWGIHTRSHLPSGPSHSLSAAMNHHQHQNMNSHSSNSGISMGMGSHGYGHAYNHAHTHNRKLMNTHMGVNGAMIVGPTGTNPWLSAIPRSIGGLADMTAGWRAKRCAEELEESVSDEKEQERQRVKEREIQRPHPSDEEYDGEESASPTGDEKSPSRDGKAVTLDTPFATGTNLASEQNQSNTEAHHQVPQDKSTVAAGDEKKAAWLLMKLSVKDGQVGAASPIPLLPSVSALGTPMMGSSRWCKDEVNGDGPRVKRRRALSM
ncbi:hypothetical protein SS1G_01927 [Sclerotinia sclerotiorum 1980 UF-70]|uniref:HTH APSES-type domain-containing protein n=2 Tax=Sclerotinia sclerotiorum (strain ATCC 18683 / 1980 / Ss-1) TaxID=665079 RepID=A7E9E7_SCLS1|nr:hypothetical protein SS1G_01927 [Sclerotinia sclerotiorum 1980 UF-70]APA05722.1 hypothetical protein sscle_01g004920 [Sclerotinia sclerotiorum 1980 UF-70]EDN96999.1 hypothetical protein SS1G_01927 [Sclerotinia sclerotiorum 1980 UF-70]